MQKETPHSRDLTERSTLRSANLVNIMPKVPSKLREKLKNLKQQQRKSLELVKVFESFAKTIFSKKECALCQMTVNNGCLIAQCSHMFCEECIENYLIFKIDSMEEILCPDKDCDKKLDSNVKAFKNLQQNYKQKHKKQQLWQQTITNPDMKLCPIETCQQGTINMRNIPPQCKKCQVVFCKQCMMKQHSNISCDQNFELIFKQFKRCPKCSMFINKTEGSNYLMCFCKHQFCFVCLKEWTTDHYSCVQNSQVDSLIIQEVKYPKIMAGFMVTLLPFLVLAFLAVFVLVLVSGFVFGFFCGIGIYIQFAKQIWFFSFLMIVVLPICMVIHAIVGAIWASFIQFLPFLSIHFIRYINKISYLWRAN